MIFIETPIFTKDVETLLSDDQYSALQQELADRPDSGNVIQGTGGLRKIRWALSGGGKRGGARVIYFWRVSESQILMLAIYSKGEKLDLTTTDKKALRKVVERWK